jgi:hypothetical protein
MPDQTYAIALRFQIRHDATNPWIEEERIIIILVINLMVYQRLIEYFP